MARAFSPVDFAVGPMAMAFVPVVPALSRFPTSVEFTEKYFTVDAFS